MLLTLFNSIQNNVPKSKLGNPHIQLTGGILVAYDTCVPDDTLETKQTFEVVVHQHFEGLFGFSIFTAIYAAVLEIDFLTLKTIAAINNSEKSKAQMLSSPNK